MQSNLFDDFYVNKGALILASIIYCRSGIDIDLPPPLMASTKQELKFIFSTRKKKNSLAIDDALINQLVNQWHNPHTSQEVRQILERKFAGFIAKAATAEGGIVCREDFYLFTHLLHVPVHVFFYPGSESYTRYGAGLALDILYADQVDQIMHNYHSDPPMRTKGYLQAECSSSLQLRQLSDQQVNQLETIGFHTRDVYRIING